MMRTDEEIIARIRNRQEYDDLGWETSELIIRLPFEKAKSFLKPEVTAGEYEVRPRDRDSILKAMLDYMPFAWDKANNCRGISAARSMCHYMAWTWLAGDDFGDLLDYEFYGKPHLERICEHYGWDWKQWDDGRRRNSEEE
jgi:hypothetical protein